MEGMPRQQASQSRPLSTCRQMQRLSRDARRVLIKPLSSGPYRPWPGNWDRPVVFAPPCGPSSQNGNPLLQERAGIVKLRPCASQGVRACRPSVKYIGGTCAGFRHGRRQDVQEGKQQGAARQQAVHGRRMGPRKARKIQAAAEARLTAFIARARTLQGHLASYKTHARSTPCRSSTVAFRLLPCMAMAAYRGSASCWQRCG